MDPLVLPDGSELTIDELLAAPESIRQEYLDLLHERAHLSGHWLTDFSGWLEALLGEACWSKQREIADAVTEHRKVAVPASFGVGKSWTGARIAARWIQEHEPGSAMVVTTAPTYRQLRAILWREMNKAHSKGNLIGRMNQVDWMLGKEIIGMGASPADTDEDTFQGIHAEFVLVIIDEAGGVPAQRFQDAEKLLTNDDCRLLAIGNTNYEGSHWSNVCSGAAPGWHTIKISAFDSPNFTGEEVDPRIARMLVSQTWVDEMGATYGVDSPTYKQRVEAEFPKDMTDGIVPRSAALECAAIEGPPRSADDQVTAGLDVGAGGDETVLREVRNGFQAGRTHRIREANDQAQAQMIADKLVDWGVDRLNIDAIGIGYALGSLIQTKLPDGYQLEVNGIKVSEKSSEPDRFVNLRAEIYWMARTKCIAKEWALAEVDNETIDQLTAVRYFRKNNRIQVESKDELKKASRLGRSPDDADALLLAFYERPAGGVEYTANTAAKRAQAGTAELPSYLQRIMGQ